MANTEPQEIQNELKQLKSKLYSSLENLTEAFCWNNVLLYFHIICNPVKGVIP